MSEGVGEGSAHPPRMRGKKSRPFSAPRHQGLRSLGLKNKVAGASGNGTISQSIQPAEYQPNDQRPGTGVYPNDYDNGEQNLEVHVQQEP